MIFGTIKSGIKTIYTAISDSRKESDSTYEKIAEYCHGCKDLEYNSVVRDMYHHYRNQFICRYGDVSTQVPGEQSTETDCPHVRELQRSDCNGCGYMLIDRELDTWIATCNKHIDHKRCKYEKDNS
jgi:hypothetical protein